MVGVAAEGPVTLLAPQDEKQAHGVQDLPGPAYSGHTRANAPADGRQTWEAAGAVPGLVIQVQSCYEGAACHGSVEDLPGNQGKGLGRGEEALVDALGVDHAAQLLIVSVSMDVSDVSSVRELIDRFAGGGHGQRGQLGQPGQGLPAAAQGIAAAVQDGSQTPGAEAESLVQNQLIRYAECRVVSMCF